MKTFTIAFLLFSLGVTGILTVEDLFAAREDYQPSIATARILLGGGWIPLPRYEEFWRMGCKYPRSKYFLRRATEQKAFNGEEVKALCNKVEKRAMLTK
jgi:hypothetical protein